MMASDRSAESQSPAETRQDRLRDLGGTIRELRQERRLSTVALAKACGVSTSLISQVERGLTSPSLDVLWSVARTLDVPIGTFFQGSAPEELPGKAPVVVRVDQR
jgi:transcriptional regulator with XRE-family HTH domain